MTDEKFTNRLAGETSPYLLQHAHNPVSWYPWGAEALERSREEDKPILLSIGYSACHWCHVMEHESFEDEEIAAVMNEHFVCIKVDREERPDLDSIYMSAVQMLTRHGGWPLTVFLTPDLKPFYGGTYYPPADFKHLLLTLADWYRNRRGEVFSSAEAVTDELNSMNRFRVSSDMLTTEILNDAYAALSKSFDWKNGGLGAAPKFPPSMSMMFLLAHHRRTNSPAALEMVELTLEKMASGGMYDQLGGGFHRYSVDESWLVPHFEKMLYDNALLVRVYLYAYQMTRKPRYRRVAEETLEYVIRDMTDRDGGFYSSEDADSEGEEGRFYTWGRDEVIEILGPADGPLFCDCYDVTERGNFEHGRSILNTPVSPEELGRSGKGDAEEIEAVIERGKKKLLAARENRVRPARDEKVLTAWNGLMLTAFAEAANILGRDDYRLMAQRNAEFILARLARGEQLLRTFKAGEARLKGYAEDYAFVIEGLLALYEATFDLRYFERARSLADVMIDKFWDEAEAGFFFTASDHERLIARVKDFFDNAIPSANSAAALTLLKLSLFTNDNRYQKRALAVLRMMQQAMSRYASAFGYLLCALDFYLAEPKEIAIVGLAGSHEVRAMLDEIYSRFLPHKVVALAGPGDQQAADAIALLMGKTSIDNKSTAYVCRNYTCLTPVTTAEGLAAQLEG